MISKDSTFSEKLNITKKIVLQDVHSKRESKTQNPSPNFTPPPHHPFPQLAPTRGFTKPHLGN